MCKKHLIWWYTNHHLGCKGTTKNAYTQVFAQKKTLFNFLRTQRRRSKRSSQVVRGVEVIRLLGDKWNPHNRMKKNRLCGLVV